MSESATQELYIISYLLEEADDENVLGYSNLAARIQYLCNIVKNDEKISDSLTSKLDEMVSLSEENVLDWDSLKRFIENARTDRIGSMFLSVQTEEIEPNEWTYKFESSAPEPVLEEKIESMSERDEALKQKIKNAANIDKDEMYGEIYKL